jgi:hypothetical protein
VLKQRKRRLSREHAAFRAKRDKTRLKQRKVNLHVIPSNAKNLRFSSLNCVALAIPITANSHRAFFFPPDTLCGGNEKGEGISPSPWLFHLPHSSTTDLQLPSAV